MSDPKYKKLATQLQNDIVSGVYPVGGKLPSEIELIHLTGYSRQTVRQALEVLEQEGLATRIQGSGTYVKERILSHSPTYNIAVVTTSIDGYIFKDILQGIYDVLSEQGYAPILFATAGKVENERSVLMKLLEKPVDGIIIQGTKTALPSPNLDLYRELEKLNIPIVFINSYHSEVKPAVYVCADDKTGGAEACEYLINKGHSEIACILKSDDMPGVNRYYGYISTLLNAGIQIQDEKVIWFNTENRTCFLDDRVLSILKKCTGLICYNDEVAIETIHFLSKSGISVPDQIEIVSFDNTSIAQLSPVPFLSLSHPKAQMGQIAAKKIINMLSEKKETSVLLHLDTP